MRGDADLVAATVRDADPDRYLSALYAPEGKRRALLALYAFDVEISSVRARVSQPMPGEIRLQWWRDAIDSGDSAAGAGNPVLAELLRAIAEHGLQRSAFERYLEARVFDLYDDPMPSRSDLEGYAGETTSAWIQLSALVLEAKAATDVAEAAGHAGCAQAVVTLLRALPLHRARGQCYAPLDVLAAAGTSREEWLAGAASGANDRAFAAMLALGREHLGVFQRAAQDLPESLRAAFLPVALIPAYLAALERAGQARTGPLEISALRRHWLLLRHATRGWRSVL